MRTARDRSSAAPKLTSTDIIPVRILQLAQEQKALPFGPALAHRILTSYLPTVNATPPTVTIGSQICAEFSITPRQFAAIALMAFKASASTAWGDESKTQSRAAVARHMLTTAALLGDHEAVVAQYNLLHKAEKNRFVRMELREAEKRLRKVADEGYIGAWRTLGLIAKDEGRKEEAKKWFDKITQEREGDGYAHYGEILFETGDTVGAREWWQKGLETDGDMMCYWHMAVDVLSPEDPLYEDYLLNAASRGHQKAPWKLGVYYHEVASEPNLDMAKEWYSLACSLHEPSVEQAGSRISDILETQGKSNQLGSFIGKEWAAKIGSTSLDELETPTGRGSMKVELFNLPKLE
jgi:tetratricopeptide (TPR) repeat protein